MDIAEATVSPRVHHQWLPDNLYVEKSIDKNTQAELNRIGHNVKETDRLGSAHSIMKVGNYYYGFSDPRRPGSLASGY